MTYFIYDDTLSNNPGDNGNIVYLKKNDQGKLTATIKKDSELPVKSLSIAEGDKLSIADRKNMIDVQRTSGSEGDFYSSETSFATKIHNYKIVKDYDDTLEILNPELRKSLGDNFIIAVKDSENPDGVVSHKMNYVTIELGDNSVESIAEYGISAHLHNSSVNRVKTVHYANIEGMGLFPYCENRLRKSYFPDPKIPSSVSLDRTNMGDGRDFLFILPREFSSSPVTYDTYSRYETIRDMLTLGKMPNSKAINGFLIHDNLMNKALHLIEAKLAQSCNNDLEKILHSYDSRYGEEIFEAEDFIIQNLK